MGISFSLAGLGASGCLGTQHICFVSTRPSYAACDAPLQRMCATHTSRYRSTCTNPFSKFMSSRQKVAIRRSSCSSGSAACQQCRSTFFRETRFFRRSNASASPSRTSASVTATARSAGSVARRSASTSEKLPCAKLRMFFLVTSKGHSPSTDAAKHARACVSHASASLASTHAASGIAGAIEARGRRTSTRRATREVTRTRIFRRFFTSGGGACRRSSWSSHFKISSDARERDDRHRDCEWAKKSLPPPRFLLRFLSSITPSSFPSAARRRRRSPGSACSAPPARAPPASWRPACCAGSPPP